MRRLRRARVTAVGAVLAMAIGGCGGAAAKKAAGVHPSSTTVASTTATPPPTPSGTAEAPAHRVSWHACGSGEGPAGYQCATVTVPLDPAHPGSATLPLAIDRRPASGVSAGSLLVNCLDDPAPTPAAITAAVPAFEAAAPVFGLSVLYGELQCTVWPVPATPYAGAQQLAGELTHGILLTRDGGGRTGYGASSCIRQAVDGYLISLAPPAPATTCPSDSSG